MNLCAGEYPPEVDEFEISGLTPIPSDLVKAPRVAESHVNMECRLLYCIEVSGLPGGGTLVLGEVIRFHIDDAYFHNYRIDPDKLRAIGRMAGNSYTRTLGSLRHDSVRRNARRQFENSRSKIARVRFWILASSLLSGRPFWRSGIQRCTRPVKTWSCDSELGRLVSA